MSDNKINRNEEDIQQLFEENRKVKERITKLESRVHSLESSKDSMRWVFGRFLPGIATIISAIAAVVYYIIVIL